VQIDFHHAVTYVLARLAGFDKPKANIVAYAAQYVDDATSTGTVYFDNKALYHRTSSAHKMLDPRNAQELANHLVWLPFHFLPGNGGKPAGRNPTGEFIKKIICRPNSHVARKMVADTIAHRHQPYGLHRLGVTMHVYADTWAHQGFAGVLHAVNEVENARETKQSGVFDNPLKDLLRDLLDDAIPPLGHGRANVFPDMPFLSWEYKNGAGELVQRDNTAEFMAAARQMHQAMQRFIIGDPDAAANDLLLADRDRIRSLFESLRIESGEERHKQWLMAIRQGQFSFGAETVTYAARGKNSWKAKALGISHDLRAHTYKPRFLASNWKLFHDAVMAHRFFVIHDLLPRYGICAA